MFGVPFIGLVFFMEGLLVGKMLPTRIMLVVLVVTYAVQLRHVAFLFAVVAICSTIGQYVLFRELYGSENKVIESKWIRVSEEKIKKAEEIFDRHGRSAIFFTNAMPIFRGYLTIPAAVEGMDSHRFIVYSFLGSLVYFTWVIGIGIFAAELIIGDTSI